MLNIVALGRIGTLGVGLGVGATLASLPGIASADPAPGGNFLVDILPSLF
jgi:hypothetical protein